MGIDIHRKFINRCFELAGKGRGYTLSNPMVGALLVKYGKIVSEGYHRKYGEAHAEVDCLSKLPEDYDYSDTVLYISLEPCCIDNKTPPCTNLIVSKGIPSVVIASEDFNPLVKGKGIQYLLENGIEVVNLKLDDKQKLFNIIFYTLQINKRPYVTVKYAQSIDKYIGQEGNQVKISRTETDVYTHKLRAECDVILVGKNTWENDSPRLTTRNYYGENSAIVVLSNKPISVPNHKIYDVKILNYNALESNISKNLEHIAINPENISLILDDLYYRNYSHVLLEGGKEIIESFAKAKLIDELLLISSSTMLHEGIKSPDIDLSNCIKESQVHLNTDILTTFKFCDIK